MYDIKISKNGTYLLKENDSSYAIREADSIIASYAIASSVKSVSLYPNSEFKNIYLEANYTEYLFSFYNKILTFKSLDGSPEIKINFSDGDSGQITFLLFSLPFHFEGGKLFFKDFEVPVYEKLRQFMYDSALDFDKFSGDYFNPSTSGNFNLIDPLNPPPEPTPTIAISTNSISVLEGGYIDFLIETTEVSAGTVLSYKIGGVQASDLVDKQLSGTTTIGSDGTASIRIYTANDSLIEGDELLSVTISGHSAQVTVRDDTTVKVAEVLYESDQVALYKTTFGQYALAESAVAIGEVLQNFLPLMATATKSYIPKGAIAVLSYDDGSFGLISKSGLGSAAKYAELKFSADGLAQGKALKITTAQLLAKEVLADQDINGDGVVGEIVATVLDGDGDNVQQTSGLYKTVAGTIVIGVAGLDVGDLVGVSTALMSSAKKGWTVPSGSTVEGIAFTDGGSLEVLTRKGTAFTAQKFDDVTGLMMGKAVKLKPDQLEAREYYYDLDLTGDGVVSLVGQELPPAGWLV